jgi:hypothetical protein
VVPETPARPPGILSGGTAPNGLKVFAFAVALAIRFFSKRSAFFFEKKKQKTFIRFGSVRLMLME